MSLNVGNCPKCGKMYVLNIQGLCPNCLRDIENQYEKCLKFLRENRSCTISELSDETGVSVQQITKFIREGRISLRGNPNMSISCEVCGSAIREGMMCESCRVRLAKDAANMTEDEKRKRELGQQGNNVSFNIKDRLDRRR